MADNNDNTLNLNSLAGQLGDIATAYFQARTADKATTAAANATPYVLGAMVLLVGIWLLRSK